MCLNIGIRLKVINSIQLLHDSEGDMDIYNQGKSYFPRETSEGNMIF